MCGRAYPAALVWLATACCVHGCGSCFGGKSSTDTSTDAVSDATPASDAASDSGGSDADAGDTGTTTDAMEACVPSVPPVEVCDGADNDCDGTFDFSDCGLGLEAWYRFEEVSGTVIDSSGNGWDGTPVGSPVQGGPGPVGLALGCTGVNGDYVNVPTGPVFDATGGWTVEAWVGYAGWPAATKPFAKASGLNPTFVDVFLIADGNPIAFTNVNWTACDDSHCASPSTASQQPPTMSFYHTALTYDGAFLTEYFNGLEVWSLLDATFVFGTWSEPLTICAWLVEGGQTWDGIIDELKFWSVARSEEEICTDAGGSYSGGPPATCVLP